MKLLHFLGLLLLLFFGVACASEKTDEATVPDISGPALLMFYTDN